jgi:hypothetical protein
MAERLSGRFCVDRDRGASTTIGMALKQHLDMIREQDEVGKRRSVVSDEDAFVAKARESTAMRGAKVTTRLEIKGADPDRPRALRAGPRARGGVPAAEACADAACREHEGRVVLTSCSARDERPGARSGIEPGSAAALPYSSMQTMTTATASGSRSGGRSCGRGVERVVRLPGR